MKFKAVLHRWKRLPWGYSGLWRCCGGLLLCVAFLGFVLSIEDILALSKPVYDYDYVLENGLRKDDRIEGELYYSLGVFDTDFDTQTIWGVKVWSSLKGYCYAIPVGESGVAAIYVKPSDRSAMQRLTRETYQYQADGAPIQSRVPVSGRVSHMSSERELFFRQFLKESMGYTEAEIQEMLAANTDGKYLMIWPYDAGEVIRRSVGYAATAVLGVVLVTLNRKKTRKKDWEL